jgi:hypothetical protein
MRVPNDMDSPCFLGIGVPDCGLRIGQQKDALIGRIYLRSPFLFLKAQNRSCMQGESIYLRVTG